MELRRVPISVALEVCRAARCCHGASPDVIGVALELCVHSAAMEQQRRLPVLRCGSHRRLLELRCSTRCCIGALARDAGAARSPEQVPRRVMHHRCWVQTEALCGLMGVDRGGCKTKSRCHGCVAEGCHRSDGRADFHRTVAKAVYKSCPPSDLRVAAAFVLCIRYTMHIFTARRCFEIGVMLF